MTNEEIIADKKYHTCGRCEYEDYPDNMYPCNQCVNGFDHRKDMWELKRGEQNDE